MILETVQLRMIAITACFATQYRLRKQRFPPKRDKTLWIEILGMQ